MRCPGGPRPAPAVPARPTDTSRSMPVRGGRGRSTAHGSFACDVLAAAIPAPAGCGPRRCAAGREASAPRVPRPRPRRRRPVAGTSGARRRSRAVCAVRDTKKLGSFGRGSQLVAESGVGGSGPACVLGCSGTSRDLPNLDSRISSTPCGPVDVAAVELDRLADPQPADCQQPDQRLVGRGPQRRADRACGPGPSALRRRPWSR